MRYKIVFAFLKLLSRLPFWCLFGISDFFFVILFYVIRYRRKVILSNLSIAFPDNSIQENNKIAKKFGRHFADMLIESLKALSISEQELKMRFVVENPQLIRNEIDAGKSSILLTGHYGNWEWLLHDKMFSGVMSWAAYTPLSNPTFDKLMVANRERYGFKVFPSKQAASMLAKLSKEGTPFINLLLADQSPPFNYKYRATFLGKEVPFFIGPEAYAKKYNLVVFYGSINKIARGKYTMELIPISLNAQQTEHGWITSEYIRLMEEDIRKVPEYYLWSHRRFKHAQIS